MSYQESDRVKIVYTGSPYYDKTGEIVKISYDPLHMPVYSIRMDETNEIVKESEKHVWKVIEEQKKEPEKNTDKKTEPLLSFEECIEKVEKLDAKRIETEEKDKKRMEEAQSKIEVIKRKYKDAIRQGKEKDAVKYSLDLASAETRLKILKQMKEESTEKVYMTPAEYFHLTNSFREALKEEDCATFEKLKELLPMFKEEKERLSSIRERAKKAIYTARLYLVKGDTISEKDVAVRESIARSDSNSGFGDPVAMWMLLKLIERLEKEY